MTFDVEFNFNASYIDGEVLSPDITYFIKFLQLLALDADGRRVFIARGVCKSWKAHVDAMDNGHWSILHACLVDDPLLAKFLVSRSIHIYDGVVNAVDNSAQQVNMKLLFRNAVKSRSQQPGVLLLLNLCKLTAARAALTPRPFATAFDNELRGLAYYAVWLGVQKKPDKDEENPKAALLATMEEWWRQSIKDLHAHVTSRTAHSAESVKAAARASLESYVRKMAAIPFHACRQSARFEESGLTALLGPQPVAPPPDPHAPIVPKVFRTPASVTAEYAEFPQMKALFDEGMVFPGPFNAAGDRVPHPRDGGQGDERRKDGQKRLLGCITSIMSFYRKEGWALPASLWELISLPRDSIVVYVNFYHPQNVRVDYINNGLQWYLDLCMQHGNNNHEAGGA